MELVFTDCKFCVFAALGADAADPSSAGSGKPSGIGGAFVALLGNFQFAYGFLPGGYRFMKGLVPAGIGSITLKMSCTRQEGELSRSWSRSSVLKGSTNPAAFYCQIVWSEKISRAY